MTSLLPFRGAGRAGCQGSPGFRPCKRRCEAGSNQWPEKPVVHTDAELKHALTRRQAHVDIEVAGPERFKNLKGFQKQSEVISDIMRGERIYARSS